MRNALWLSRHRPTAAQLKEIASIGTQLVAVEEGLALGARELVDDEDVGELLCELHRLAKARLADQVFGVFPAPLMERICEDTACIGRGEAVPMLACWSAWNVRRAVEGSAPTFEHKRWCETGYLKLERELDVIIESR